MSAILHPGDARRKLRLDSAAAAAGLDAYVAHYWIVHWDLRGQPPHEQHVLPHAGVNMTFKTGRCRVAGVPRGRFSEVLSGSGRVFGVRFRAGGFRGLLGAPVATITDRFLPVEAVFGPDGRVLAEAILAAGDEAAVALADEFLLSRVPPRPDPAVLLAAAIVARTAESDGPARVADLAAEFGLSVRGVQRLFAEYVGVSPKWVIRRHRLHEAAARASAGVALDLAALAAELGYADQAHLSRDFRAMVGVPPSHYVRSAQRV